MDKKTWKKIGFIEGNSTSNKEYTYFFQDNNLTVGIYYYRLSQTNHNGAISYSEVIAVTLTVPNEFALKQNYPNPFNPTTTLTYELPRATNVKLRIYNLLGQVVRILVNDFKQAGSYTVQWDGKNNSGLQLPSGIYIYRLQAGNFSRNMKMVLMK